MGEYIVRRFLAVLMALALCSPAAAQVTAPIYKNQAGTPQQSIGMICLNTDGTVCSFGGGGGGGASPFTPTGFSSKVTAGNGSSVSGALTATGPNEQIYNSGSVGVWINLGVGSATAAPNAGYYVPPGQTFTAVGGLSDHIAAYGVGATADVYVTPGSGQPIGWGGGGGGGGGGAVTAASGSYVAGAIVDIGTGSSPAANTVNAYLKALGGQLPLALGSTTKSASLSVALASDQTLPAFASTPTFNLGSLNGAALDTSVQSVVTNTANITPAYSANLQLSFSRPATITTYTVNTALQTSTSSATSFVLANACRTNGGSGVITSLGMTSNNSPTLLLQVRAYFFSASPSYILDNVNFNISSTDVAKLQPFQYFDFQFGASTASTPSVSFAGQGNLGLGYSCPAGTTSLPVEFEVRNAYVAANGETFTLNATVEARN